MLEALQVMMKNKWTFTSGLVELKGDVSIKSQTEVVVEHIEGQLSKKQTVIEWLPLKAMTL